MKKNENYFTQFRFIPLLTSRLLIAFPVLPQIASKLEIERMPCIDSALKIPFEPTLKKE